MNNKKAFSLLELLVVIAIIGILAGVGVTTYIGIQKKGRDTRRIEDMKALQNAQEQYYLQNSSYEAFSGCSVTGFLNPAAVDPKNEADYVYECDGTTASYYVCAFLEEPTRGNSDGNCPAVDGQYSCGYTATTYYCLSNLQ